MLRYTFFGFAFLLLSLTLLSVSFAHGTLNHGDEVFDLRDVTLCLSPASFQIEVTDKNQRTDFQTSRRIQETLALYARNVFLAANVHYSEKVQCSENDAFVLILLEIFYDTNPGISSAPFYTYILNMQVGSEPASNVSAGERLEHNRFYSYHSDLFLPESSPQPFDIALPALAEQRLQDLAIYWWMDNPVAPNPSPRAWQTGAVITLLSILLSFLVSRYYKKRLNDKQVSY